MSRVWHTLSQTWWRLVHPSVSWRLYPNLTVWSWILAFPQVISGFLSIYSTYSCNLCNLWCLSLVMVILLFDLWSSWHLLRWLVIIYSLQNLYFGFQNAEHKPLLGIEPRALKLALEATGYACGSCTRWDMSQRTRKSVKTVPSIYDQQMTPTNSKLCDCLNNTWTIPTKVDIPKWKGGKKISGCPFPGLRAISNWHVPREDYLSPRMSAPIGYPRLDWSALNSPKHIGSTEHSADCIYLFIYMDM